MESIQNFEVRFNAKGRQYSNSLHALGALTDCAVLLHKRILMRVPCEFCQLKKFSSNLKSSLSVAFPLSGRFFFTNQVPICSSQSAWFVSNASVMYNLKLFLCHLREKILQSD